ncbi:MFS transporter [Rhodococcus erythropolis]
MGFYPLHLLGPRGPGGAGRGPVIAKYTPADENRGVPSVHAELRAITSGRMAILVIAMVLATGGYMTVFSYLSPLATDRAGIPEWAVPLVFVVFGTGAIIGTDLAGQFADKRPLTTFISTTAATVVIMLLLIPLSTYAAATFVLMFLLGIAGMGVPPVGTGLAARFAAAAPPGSGGLGLRLQRRHRPGHLGRGLQPSSPPSGSPGRSRSRSSWPSSGWPCCWSWRLCGSRAPTAADQRSDRQDPGPTGHRPPATGHRPPATDGL